MVEVNRNIVIYLGEDISQQILQAKISEINATLQNQGKSINDAFGTITGAIEEQNRQFRKENLELKDLLRNFQNGSSVPGNNNNMSESQLNEQLRTKENMITTLRREVHDLKVQRAESARQLSEIQKQVNELKRDPLAPKNEQKQPISLSLRFDDFDKMDRADRLIFED